VTIDYNGKKWIADFVHLRTYAEVKDDGTKENRTETINRTMSMHIRKFPELVSEITDAFSYVHRGMVVPSMRSLQFGGKAIEKINERIYNCAFANLTSWDDFHDAFFLLLCGTGFGYSVKQRHINQLPKIKVVTKHAGRLTYTVGDTKEAWADSTRMLLANPNIEFDYSLVRPKGSPISSGGTASGPEALIETHESIRTILTQASGRQLTSIEAHDIMCFIANGVVVGGVRRAALICLFDADDEAMNKAKEGEWWVENPQRGRANNSAVIYRNDTGKDGYDLVFGCDVGKTNEQILSVMDHMLHSGSGEPGISLSNDPDMGFNPCHEIALKDGGLCNLTEVNVSACVDGSDIINAMLAATFIGTLQASYTDFKVLQPKWKLNADDEALLGVSLTGQADNWKLLKEVLDLPKGLALYIKTKNKMTAELIGINKAKRITTTKPSGSTSAWLGCSSGIHADHAPYYIRHIRMEANHKIVEAVAKSKYPFVEVDLMDPDKMVIGFPVKAEDGAINKTTETAIELMERAKFIYKNWVLAGHREGNNTHNVSLTVEYEPHEIEDIKQWMVDNKDSYAGISFLPRSGGTYTQMPFQTINKETYDAMVAQIKQAIDYTSIDWTGTVDERMGEVACAGGACEIL
jgi:ribonucleoside-diphosphate reductase alpha chain